MATGDITIAELIVRFLPWVREHYRHADGTPTPEVDDVADSLRPLNHLYGRTPAQNFVPLALKAVRMLLIEGYTHPRYGPQSDLSRGVINQRIGHIRRMFKWAVENELVPPSVFHGLACVKGLQRGRTEARETKPVEPVSRAVVNRTLVILRPMHADMVRLQLETGMRPGELVIIRAADIDMSGNVWVYRPGQHKTQHHGHARSIPIGPKGQVVIRRYLTTDPQAYLFSPAKSLEDWRLAKRQARKTKVQPGQQARRKKRPHKQPGAHYTPSSFHRAIAKAINAITPINLKTTKFHTGIPTSYGICGRLS
jgi:integrase